MALRILPVQDRRQLQRFVDLPWTLYRGDPHWVPPLKLDVMNLLSPGKHPFHDHAEVQPFLAERDGKSVGRIVAHVNRAHNEFHGDDVGFFGFYECAREDEEASNALFDAAFDWLRQRTRGSARGPFELSTNEVCGLLIGGEPGPPVIMMPHQPPWYAERYEAAGLRKAKDLLAYHLHERVGLPDRILPGADRLAERQGVRLRTIEMKNFGKEVDRILALYNKCWERNWGFVPMSEAEVRHMAKELRPAVDPDLIIFMEDVGTGEPIGFLLALPDLNQAIRHANGRLFPVGLLKILWHRRKIRSIRVLTLGLVPEARGKGLDGLLYLTVWRNGIRKGYREAECSWVLEDNKPMLVPLEKMGGRHYRTYRIYEKTL